MPKSKWWLTSLLLILAFLLTSCSWFNKPPVAILNVSTTNGEAPLTVSFSGASSYDPDGSISYYDWDFEDGDYAYGATASHTYEDDGSFTATLTVTDNNGATDSDSVTVTVTNPPPIADFTYSPANPKVGDTVTFDATPSYDPASSVNPESIAYYSWDFGDGNTGSGMTVTHVYGSQGVYEVTLTVTDDDGATNTKSKSIPVQKQNELPVADFTYSPSSPEAGDTVNFDASSSSDPDGYIVAYNWDFGDGDYDDGSNTSHSYSSQGTYTVTLTVVDNGGATDSSMKELIIESNGQSDPCAE